MRKKYVLLVGAGGLGKVACDVIEKQEKYKVLGFLDDNPALAGKECYGYPILGVLDELSRILPRVNALLVTVGSNWQRSRLVQRLRSLAPDTPFATAVHPSVSVSRGVALDVGCIVGPGVSLGPDVRVGRHCVINANTALDHDVQLSDFVQVCVGASVRASAQLLEFTNLGAGACVNPLVKIGAHSHIEAASAVLHDVPPYKVAWGVPAGIVRERKIDE